MAGKGDDMAARGDGPPPGAGGPRAAGELPGGPARGRRWLARLAFAAAIAAVVVLLLFGGLRSIAALLLGLLGLAVGCAAAWFFLAYRGVVRWLALVVVVAAPVFVIVVYVVAGLLWEVALGVVLAAAAVAAGRAALSGGAPAGPPEYAAARQRQPFMIMNPRSGGGKVSKFGEPRARAQVIQTVTRPRAEQGEIPRAHCRGLGADHPAWQRIQRRQARTNDPRQVTSRYRLISVSAHREPGTGQPGRPPG
jgi:hypothetical protein